jgi:hypothetical protein
MARDGQVRTIRHGREIMIPAAEVARLLTGESPANSNYRPTLEIAGSEESKSAQNLR